MSLLAFALIALTSGNVADRAEDARPLKPPAKAPAVVIQGMDSKPVHLDAILKGKKTAIVFYRGGWCPFCNRQLADLQTALPDLNAAGYQLIAISPDLPAELMKSNEKYSLGYTLYSDSKAVAMEAFGVAFRVEPALVDKYKNSYHIDLEAASGETHHILPVPTVYLINQKGQITYIYSNPDYKVRLKGSELVAAAKASP